MTLSALLAAFLVPLVPFYPEPDPNPGGGYTNLLPNYVSNGDGTRWQCSPTLNYCLPDTTGLPSYLEG